MATKEKNIKYVPLDRIVPDEDQPRRLFDPSRLKDLSESIKKHGIMNPLIVEDFKGNYLLVDGERRLKAAKMAGLKEVPVNIIPAQSGTDRLIQQFHVQAQHEDWTSAERAAAFLKLGKELKLSGVQLGELLNLSHAIVRHFMSYGNLINQKLFQEKNIGIKVATRILSLRNLAKHTTEKFLDKEFTREDKKNFEHKIISMVESGELTNEHDFTKMKDSIRSEPKIIQKILDSKSNLTPSGLFIETNARLAYHVRNAYNSAGFLHAHLIKAHNLKGFNTAWSTKQKKALVNLQKILESVVPGIDPYDE